MTGQLLSEQDGHIVTLTINMPETRNAITDLEFADLFVDTCIRIQHDISVRAVILTGAGNAFSSGGNIKHMRNRTGSFAGDSFEARDNYRKGIQKLIRSLYELEVPVIAAVNGPAYGAGCDLACACDLRIASHDAVFAENFVKIGIIPGDGGSWLLPRAIGLARASEMTLTGDPIDSKTALEWGLVSQLVSADALLDTARALAGRIAANPPRSVRLSKRLLREGQTMRFAQLQELAAAYQGPCHQTQDHEEALTAMTEKRKPNFTGK